MDLDNRDIALWLWVVFSIVAGVGLIIIFVGTFVGIIGVVLIIIGLVSMLAAMQRTLEDSLLDI